MKETFDGGFILLGFSSSFGNNSQFWLIRTDSDGNMLWDKTYGGTKSEEGYSVQITSNGEFILFGLTSSYGDGGHDFWLLKTDSQGNEIWNKTIGGSDSDMGNSAQITSDGGYILLGSTYSYGEGETDLWLVRLESENRSPFPFTLISPADKDSILSVPHSFDWEDANDPDSNFVTYDLYYDTDSTFSNPVIIEDVTESEYLLNEELINFTTYYWKVKADDGNYGITWSNEVFSFYTYYPEAVIDLNPASFDFELWVTEQSSQNLYVNNAGNINLDYEIDWNESWLEVDPYAGSIAPAGHEIITVTCSAQGLKAGNYHDTLTITSNAKKEPVKYIPVTLVVDSPIHTILECQYPIAVKGQYFEFQAGLSNITGQAHRIDAWLDLILLNGKPYPRNPLQDQFF